MDTIQATPVFLIALFCLLVSIDGKLGDILKELKKPKE